MSKRKQHPLIVAMNKFDQLLTTLDSGNAEAFVAYVRNKVSARQPKPSKHTITADPCSQCGFEKVSACHKRRELPDYHPFVSSQPAPRAAKKSSAKQFPLDGRASSATGTATVTSAGGAGGD